MPPSWSAPAATTKDVFLDANGEADLDGVVVTSASGGLDDQSRGAFAITRGGGNVGW